MSAPAIAGADALTLARVACDTVMRKFAPEELPPRGKFYYHQGVFLSGMLKVYDLCGENKYLEYVRSWADSAVDEEGCIRSFDEGQLDYIQPGILLIALLENPESDRKSFFDPPGGERYRKALHALMEAVDRFPTTAEGGFWHNRDCRDQMWLDGLYMAGPLCARYAAVFGEDRYFDLCTAQILLMEKITRDAASGLWVHACDMRRQMPWADPATGKSPEFWGRSIGWVPVAVLEVLDDLPETHRDRPELIRLVTSLLRAVCRFQDGGGLWYQVLNKGGKPDNWLESSCTCLFAGAIRKAVRNGFLEKQYLENAERAFRGIVDRLRVDESGIILDDICVGTGVGDYAHYCARPRTTNDLHGIGAFLYMCAEAAKGSVAVLPAEAGN